MKNEFLNKTISSNLTKIHGFEIEAVIEIDNDCTRLFLKSFKDGNTIYSVAKNYHNFSLNNAINSNFEILERGIKNFEVFIKDDFEKLLSFLSIQLDLRANCEGIVGKFSTLNKKATKKACSEIINTTKNKEEALRYLNDNFYELVDKVKEDLQ